MEEFEFVTSIQNPEAEVKRIQKLLKDVEILSKNDRKIFIKRLMRDFSTEEIVDLIMD